MAFIQIPAVSELFILAVIIIYWFLVIKTAVSVLRRPDLDTPMRALWIVLLFIAPLLGLIIYNFYGQPQSSRS